MSENISIENYEVVNNLLLLSFNDNTEAVINLKELRQRCPCASCEGEKDALGNLYKGPEQKLNENPSDVFWTLVSKISEWRHMSVVISIPDRGGGMISGFRRFCTYARI